MKIDTPILVLDEWDLEINPPDNGRHTQFIGMWDDIFKQDYCDHLIKFIEKTDFYTLRSNINRQDKQINLQCFDTRLNDHIMVGIAACLDQYRLWYPELSTLEFHSSANLLQKTEPKQGYHTFHAENTTLDQSHRTLAWTIYLNDVDEGGETEFLYQQLKVKPKRGSVAIWPAGFTHVHRGNPPMTTKYIATGWLCANPIGLGVQVL